VLPQHLVQLRLVVANAFFEALDDEHARQAELPALELALARPCHGNAPRGDLPAADLLAGVGVDHRHRLGQDHRGAHKCTAPQARNEPHRAEAPGTTRTPASSYPSLSGTLSAYSNGWSSRVCMAAHLK